MIPPPKDNDIAKIAYVEDAIEASIYSHQCNQIIKLSVIRDYGQKDIHYRNLQELIEKGFPSHKESIPSPLHEFWAMRTDLYTKDKVIFIDEKPLIPKSLRTILPNELHIGLIYRTSESPVKDVTRLHCHSLKRP